MYMYEFPCMDVWCEGHFLRHIDNPVAQIRVCV